MRKPIIFFLILSLVAVQGCHQNSGYTPRQQARLEEQEREDLQREHPELEDAKTDLVWSGITLIGVLSAWPFVAIYDVCESASRPNAGEAAIAMNDEGNADARRSGIINLVMFYSYAKKPPYTDRYKLLAQKDPDFTVRAMAIRALNISRDASATGIFIAALDDDNELIRLEGVKALVNVPDPAAIPILEHILDGRRESALDGTRLPDEAMDVRIAAADALRRYPKLDVARNLVGYLNEQDFGVAWQSHRSLGVLTGRDFQYDQGAWLAYLTGPSRPFK
jgi:HEAT repeats